MIIYKTTNLVNNKIYIGQTNGHRKDYKGSGKILKYAIDKYGLENFKTEIIVEGDFSQKETDNLEIYYINLFDSTNHKIGYNIESGGMGSKITVKTEYVRAKISNANKKRFSKPEERLKISTALKEFYKNNPRERGIPLSESHKQKMRGTRGRSINNRGFKIIQKDINNNIIKIWNNATDICIELGIHKSTLYHCYTSGFIYRKQYKFERE